MIKEMMNEVVYNMVNNGASKKDIPTRFKTITKFLEIFGGTDKYIKEVMLQMIDETPDILTMQDKDGKNIGMLAAENNVEEIVLKALDNDKASIQQDKNGNNIGMYAAMNNMKEAASKALKNPIASDQENNFGMDIKDVMKTYHLETGDDILIDTINRIRDRVKESEDSEETNKAISDIYDEVFGK